MRNWNRKTSSSKLSSVSTSFSTAAKGNFNHNRRTNSKVPENVDPTRTAFNKILIDKDIRQVYKEVFGEALAEYNANQVAKKHPERQKKDYYSSICHDKKTEPFREAVVQIGNKDKQIPRWESNEILQKFLKRFQENNPQLVVVGAYIHNDEATPHMHIDYVPVATYSKGLKKRVSNDKALNQMGYKTWNDWKDSQMACLENLVREKGYDREYMNNSNRHIADVEQFKRVQKEVERQAIDPLQHFQRVAQAGFGAARQVDLGDVTGNDRFRVKADTRQEHFHLFDGGVLALIENDERIVQRTTAHVGERGNFNNVTLNELLDLLKAQHFEQRIV